MDQKNDTVKLDEICKNCVAVVLALTTIVLIWWFAGHIPLWLYPELEKTPGSKLNAGTFGDSFGFINSLFSSLAFSIAMIALAVQSYQSKRANEIAEHTAELQKQMMDDQKRQRFQAIFGKIVTDMSHVINRVATLIKHCSRINNAISNETTDEGLELLKRILVELQMEVDQSVSILMSNNGILAFVFAGLDESLGDAICKWNPVVNDLISSDKHANAIHLENAQDEMEKLFNNVVDEINKVWQEVLKNPDKIRI